MKISKSQLKQIIKEELETVMDETIYRDLNEQEAQVLDLSNPDEFVTAYNNLRRYNRDKHPVLKVPGKEEYYQVRDTRKTGRTSTGDYDNKFGAALDYSTRSNMSQPGLAAQIEPGDRAVTNIAGWLAQTLSNKTDKLEVVG